MTPSNAKVLVADVRHVASAKAANVTSTKATHMAAAATTTTVPSATAAAGLCARGKKATGKHCAC
jgi:hypothetical protein